MQATPLLITAVLLALGMRKYDNADAVIPVLCSIDCYTPSYWGQSRFGMLLPLLAMPFREPRLNYFVQALLASVALVGACLLIPGGWKRGLVALALCLACYSDQVLAAMASFSQPYSVGLVLALGAWQATNRKGWRLATSLYMLAFWVNLSQAPVSLLSANSRRHRWLVVTCTLVCATAARFNPYYVAEEYRLQLPKGRAVGLFLQNLTTQVSPWPTLAVLLLALLAWRLPRKQSESPCLGHLLAAALLGTLVACSAWVEGNGYAPRYFSVGYLCLAAFVATPLANRARPWLTWCLPLLALLRVMPLRPDAALQNWQREHLAGEARRLNASMLGGNYFTVFPAIFGDPGLAPLTQRGEVLQKRWQPLLQSGKIVALRPEEWIHLVFFLQAYCGLTDPGWVSSRAQPEFGIAWPDWTAECSRVGALCQPETLCGPGLVPARRRKLADSQGAR